MKQIVQWCLELGIACVSVYAFSIDNFRRPQEEVDALMQLAAAKFEELLHVSNHQCCVYSSSMPLA
jgi:ditrans,polycis-polyprenyl diphosphate synthase